MKILAVGAAEAAILDAASSLAANGDEDDGEDVVEIVAAAGLAGPEGEEKNEVIEALALGFLAALDAMSAAFRLAGVDIAETNGQSFLRKPKRNLMNVVWRKWS